MIKTSTKKATLVLENGMVFEGKSLGAEGTVFGEVVFHTGCCGFVETLTDPSYYGQILAQTFPLIGNYGINHADAESKKCWLSGYVVREWCELPSNFRMEGSMEDFLKEQNVVAIYDIDTRKLTKTIRENGVMNGAIVCGDFEKEALLKEIAAYQAEAPIATVSVKEPVTCGAEDAAWNVAVLDFGVKRSIVSELKKRGCKVTILPAATPAEAIKEAGYHGVLLSNGPADPAQDAALLDTIKALTEAKMPLMGIGLGHQMLALANGFEVQKMKHGHRGANQPVLDRKHNRTFVTAQNHGYEVVLASVDESIAAVSHVNANDGSCEGLRYHHIPAVSAQFYPGYTGGPLSTAYLYDEFVSMMKGEEL